MDPELEWLADEVASSVPTRSDADNECDSDCDDPIVLFDCNTPDDSSSSTDGDSSNTAYSTLKSFQEGFNGSRFVQQTSNKNVHVISTSFFGTPSEQEFSPSLFNLEETTLTFETKLQRIN